jgi:hypothetical protein
MKLTQDQRERLDLLLNNAPYNAKPKQVARLLDAEYPLENKSGEQQTFYELRKRGNKEDFDFLPTTLRGLTQERERQIANAEPTPIVPDEATVAEMLAKPAPEHLQVPIPKQLAEHLPEAGLIVKGVLVDMKDLSADNLEQYAAQMLQKAQQLRREAEEQEALKRDLEDANAEFELALEKLIKKAYPEFKEFGYIASTIAECGHEFSLHSWHSPEE